MPSYLRYNRYSEDNKRYLPLICLIASSTLNYVKQKRLLKYGTVAFPYIKSGYFDNGKFQYKLKPVKMYFVGYRLEYKKKVMKKRLIRSEVKYFIATKKGKHK